MNIPKTIVLLNGPPRSGKDTAFRAIKKFMPYAQELKFTSYVKQETHRLYGIECEEETYEILKDVPLPEFKMLTPRQAYIKRSLELRSEYGEDVVARNFVSRLRKAPSPFIVNSDIGTDLEAELVLSEVGPLNILCLQIEREGHSFASDCRSYVNLKGVDCRRIRNDQIDAFESEVVAAVNDFMQSNRTDLKLSFG